MHPAVALARYWPFANGSGRVLDRFAKSVKLGSGEITCKTSDGFYLTVLADDLIGRHIALSGKFDRSPVEQLLRWASPGDVLVDVGANIGYVSGCFLKNVPGGKVICIEPQPGVVDLLRNNLAQFGKRSVVHQVALSDDDADGWLQINSVNRGSSKIVGKQDADAVQVRMTNAGTLFSTFDRMDLLKIDVEGMEEVVFRSIEPELNRLEPKAILFEDQTGEAAPDGKIGSILNRAGYMIHSINKTLFKTKLTKVGACSDCRANDYLAVKQL
jgi:FkbM family methyltransferase